MLQVDSLRSQLKQMLDACQRQPKKEGEKGGQKV